VNFDDVLNILDPTEKEVMTQVVFKHPQIKQGWMRQDDYSRKLDEFRPVMEFANAWDAWREENWDDGSGSTKAEALLKARIQELEAAQEGNMTFDQINTHIASLGLAKTADLNSVLSEKEKTFTDSLQGSAYVGAKLAEIASRHVLEFKEPFKATEFLTKVGGYGTNDLDMAYDMHVRDARKTRDEESLQARLKQIETEAFEKGKREAVDGLIQSNGASITPTNDSSNDLGHFQRRQQGMVDDIIPEGRSAASFAAQKYREENLLKANA